MLACSVMAAVDCMTIQNSIEDHCMKDKSDLDTRNNINLVAEIESHHGLTGPGRVKSTWWSAHRTNSAP